MRKELLQRQQETKTLKEDFDKRNRQIQKESKELDETCEKVEALKVCTTYGVFIYMVICFLTNFV